MKMRSVLSQATLGLLFVCSLQGCSSTWESEKEGFMTACKEGAKSNAQLASVMDKYCDCVFDKLKAKYPSPNDVPQEENAIEKVMTEMAPTCMKPLMKELTGGEGGDEEEE